MAIEHEGTLIAAAQGRMQHGAIFRFIDTVTAKHRIAFCFEFNRAR